MRARRQARLLLLGALVACSTVGCDSAPAQRSDAADAWNDTTPLTSGWRLCRDTGADATAPPADCAWEEIAATDRLAGRAPLWLARKLELPATAPPHVGT
ncbi:MAG TPA: hypothetical protein VFX50_10300, partial [Gemmatimonadales bacterium]|nr:hypothetical protein [Gemmatimonadales bacterium]